MFEAGAPGEELENNLPGGVEVEQEGERNQSQQQRSGDGIHHVDPV